MPIRLEDRKVLVVDDDRDLRASVTAALVSDGFTNVTGVGTCLEAFEEYHQENPPELLLLDVALPDGNGIQLLHRIRHSSDVPTLIMTGRDDILTKDDAYAARTDDYITKPFHTVELLHRVRAVLRRTYGHDSTVNLESAQIDFSRGEVYHASGETHQLTSSEFMLLQILAENGNHIVTTDGLISRVWGPGAFNYKDSLMSHIRRIRQKIEANPSEPSSLLTVRGLGYKLLVK
jgi:DNA-binding response OmpR family regulator